MSNKSKARGQHRSQSPKIEKDKNPYRASGALTVAFTVMRGQDGAVITIHIQNCIVNGFVHNHDKANEWLKSEGAYVTQQILQQMLRNMEHGVVQQHQQPDGTVTDQKLVVLPNAEPVTDPEVPVTCDTVPVPDTK